MRIFYEEWSPLFEQRNRKRKILSTPIDKIETGLLLPSKSFLCLDFTHHMTILNGELPCVKLYNCITFYIFVS